MVKIESIFEKLMIKIIIIQLNDSNFIIIQWNLKLK